MMLVVMLAIGDGGGDTGDSGDAIDAGDAGNDVSAIVLCYAGVDYSNKW